METTVCLFCNGQHERPLLRRSSPRHVVCRRCGLVYQNPRPTLEEIAAYYEHGYWEDRDAVVADATRPLTEAALARGQAVVDWVHPLVEPGDLIVEIGCGHGEIISYIRDQLGCQAVGVEPSRAQADAAAKRFGLEVIQSDLEGLDLAGRQAKVVVLSHVAEHFHDPRAELARCRELLVDGGWIVVEVPNILYPNPNKRLSTWLSIEHMYYFSQCTLSRVLREAGYQVVDAQCAEYVRVLASKAQHAADDAESATNEYRQVLRAVWRHELKYWPKSIARRAASKFRKARPSAGATGSLEGA